MSPFSLVLVGEVLKSSTKEDFRKQWSLRSKPINSTALSAGTESGEDGTETELTACPLVNFQREQASEDFPAAFLLLQQENK